MHGFVDEVSQYRDCNLNSPKQWKALGEAIASNSSIKDLELGYRNHLIPDVVKPETKECLSEFYNELKKSQSIKNLVLEFTQQQEAIDLIGSPLFDLDYLLKINSIMTVMLYSMEGLLPNQISMITNALEKNQVERLELPKCVEEMGSDRIISSCIGVKHLSCYCANSSSFTAITSLIANPSSSLITLDFDVAVINIDAELMSLLVKGLKNNTTIKEFHLGIRLLSGEEEPPSLTLFNSLIDTSSFESICNSNSTLEKVRVRMSEWNENDTGDVAIEFPEDVQSFLALNKIKNQKLTVQKKVALFYLRGSFDVTPFATMNNWLLPKVMNLVYPEQTCSLNAIFQLLRGIPDLCNVKSRERESGS